MILTELQGITNAVVRRAQQQGYVLPEDIRAELTQAGLAEEQWKDVVELARDTLHFRQGRYYFLTSISPRLQKEQTNQQEITHTLRRFIRQFKAKTSQDERRQEERIPFVQPVQVQMEDGRQTTLLSRDLSPTGIRLIGTRSLLGQKVRVLLPIGETDALIPFVVRVLWTATVSEELFENGGTFIEMVLPLKLVAPNA